LPSSGLPGADQQRSGRGDHRHPPRASTVFSREGGGIQHTSTRCRRGDSHSSTVKQGRGSPWPASPAQTPDPLLRASRCRWWPQRRSPVAQRQVHPSATWRGPRSASRPRRSPPRTRTSALWRIGFGRELVCTGVAGGRVDLRQRQARPGIVVDLPVPPVALLSYASPPRWLDCGIRSPPSCIQGELHLLLARTHTRSRQVERGDSRASSLVSALSTPRATRSPQPGPDCFNSWLCRHTFSRVSTWVWWHLR